MTTCRRTSPRRSSSSIERRPPRRAATEVPGTTPVSFASPTKPASWSWEATSEEVARRYGLPVEEVVRFDQNTAPNPPGAVLEILARGEFEVALSEYPPS